MDANVRHARIPQRACAADGACSAWRDVNPRSQSALQSPVAQPTERASTRRSGPVAVHLSTLYSFVTIVFFTF